jgi:predicted DCC family thiol-disulfide oxidoreductase YuxK
MQDQDLKPILLFDGVCNLCNNSVQFIIRNDKQGKIRFAALQSETGQKLLKLHGLSTKQLQSLVLIENGKAYTHSTGALRVARLLDGGWSLLYGFVIVPAFIRNVIYRFVGANRYKWFGKKDNCMMPAPALKARFMDQ